MKNKAVRARRGIETKFRKKISKGLTFASMLLLATISLVYAQPRIGTTLQTNPFESNPSAFSNNPDTFVSGGTYMYDGALHTSANWVMAEWDVDGWVEVSDFDVPTTTFTIGWVEIKIKYLVEAPIDDTYRIEYQVAPSSTWVPLQPDISSQFDSATPALPQIRSWSQVEEPNDGTWDWNDIGNLTVRFYTTPGGDGWSDWSYMYVFEVWASVYKPPLPPSASTGISIQPPVVDTQAARRPFFVEVYAQNVTDLAGYQFTINFNTTVLSPRAGWAWSYYPFTDVAIMDLNDTAGYVSIAASIPLTDPLVRTGVTGNLSLLRVYFLVDTGMTASDYSFLTFSYSLLGNPDAEAIVHSEYHGLYGTPPEGTAVMRWVPASEFPWSNPVCTDWVELWPEKDRQWHLSSWVDNGDGRLGRSDKIVETMIEPPSGEVWWCHVDEVWKSAANPPDLNIYMILTFEEKVSPHDIAVTDVTFSPGEVAVGESVSISVTVENQGGFSENFDLSALYNDTIVETKTGITLVAGATATLNFTWDTTGVAGGTYAIKAEASVVPDETDTFDNTLTSDVLVTLKKTTSTISISTNPAKIMVGESTNISGDIVPARSGETVTIWCRPAGEQVWTILTTVITDQNSQYSYAWTPTTAGVYELKASWSGDEITLPAESPITTLEVHAVVLSIKLSGEHDYSCKEEVKIRLSALVRDVNTLEPVLDADVTIEIYDPYGNLWASEVMVERLVGTGIYEWESDATICELKELHKLEDGVYLVYTQASYNGAKVASDILQFHIDPPGEGTVPLPYYAIALILLVGVAGTILLRKLRQTATQQPKNQR